MRYLYDLIDTLEEKLLLAELGSDRLADIGAEICTTADVLKKFNEHIQIALPRFAQLFGADTLAEVLAAANMVATLKIMRHMHTCDAKEGPENPPEDPPPHKASRPSKSDGHHMMTRKQLDQRSGSTNAASLTRQLYSCPCPTTGSTDPAFVVYAVPDNLLIA
jgi:hypothetical protein